MESRLFLLPRHHCLSSGAQASAAVVAGEISALLTGRSFGASVNRAEQFIRFNAVTASGVPEMYRSVAAAGPRGRGQPQPLYLSAAASALVEASVGAALPDGALRLLDLLIRTPGSPLPSGTSCGYLMAELLSLGRHADARRVFETLGDGPRSKAIAAVWRAGRAVDAVKVFGETADTAPSRRSRYRYRTLNMMKDYLQKGDLEAASELRTWMEEAGVKLPKRQRQMLRKLEAQACPDNINPNLLFEICIKADGIDDAILCLRHMGHDGMAPPNTHLYNLVIAGLWKAGRGNDAVEMFGKMAEESCGLEEEQEWRSGGCARAAGSDGAGWLQAR